MRSSPWNASGARRSRCSRFCRARERPWCSSTAPAAPANTQAAGRCCKTCLQPRKPCLKPGDSQWERAPRASFPAARARKTAGISTNRSATPSRRADVKLCASAALWPARPQPRSPAKNSARKRRRTTLRSWPTARSPTFCPTAARACSTHWRPSATPTTS